jgi:eukaryotic-like serine/threonine-protein kinase
MQPLALAPATQLGQYQLTRRIGGGGMGEVFEAIHTTLQKRVAIKTLKQQLCDDPVVVARFVREGQLASQLRHPHIVDVTDTGVIDGFPCLVMELLEGEPFSALMKREGPLPESRVVDLLLPIIGALEFAHQRGILHRDLKPSNIFVTHGWNGEEIPKVLDFGISKLMGDLDAQLTTDSMFVGTPLYASPEMMRSERNIDARSDQYALGVILYQCLTGVRPFGNDGANALQLAMLVCEGRFDPPRTIRPELSELFETVILKAMALSPDDRFASIRNVGEALLPLASPRAQAIWMPAMTGAHSLRGPGPLATPSDGAHDPGPSSHARRSSSSRGGGLRAATAPVQVAAPGATSSQVSMQVSAQVSAPQVGATTPSMVQASASGGGGATMIVLLALLFVGVSATAIGLYALRPNQPNGSAPFAPSSANVEVLVPVAQVHFTVSTEPALALVELDQIPLGTGRVDRALPDDGSEHRLRVSAEGFEPYTLTFTSKHLPGGMVTLRRIAGKPLPPEPPVPSASGAASIRPSASSRRPNKPPVASGTGVASAKPSAGPTAPPAPATREGEGGEKGTPTGNLDPWKKP